MWRSGCVSGWPVSPISRPRYELVLALEENVSGQRQRFFPTNGSNLAAFLYLLKQKHPAEYQLIRRTVQRVTPFLDDFLLRPDALNAETIRLAWKHKDSDQYFGTAALSDGTLRFMALSTLFLQRWSTVRPRSSWMNRNWVCIRTRLRCSPLWSSRCLLRPRSSSPLNRRCS